MPAEVWKPTEEELYCVRRGVTLQHEHLSLEDFINNQINVIASLRAEVRFLRGIAHRALNREE